MTTFKVNDVSASKKRLLQGDLEEIVKHRCGDVKPEAHSQTTRQPVRELGALTRLIGIDNALVSALHTAWSNHYPLVLTPDVVWLCIAQGLAQHINANAEKLRHLFVEHEGKKTLVVQRDDFVKGSSANAWPEVFESFSSQIRDHTGRKTHDLLTPTFSTTGPVEKAAAQLVLMNCFKQYFKFIVVCVCGIPKITLEGTVEDWKQLRDKTVALAEYDLAWWIDALQPILDQFVAAASGRVDRKFWCRIYHQYGGGVYDPGPYVTGWILALFPYISSGRNEHKRNPYLTLWQNKDPASHKLPKNEDDFWHEKAEDLVGVTHDGFPPGVVSTPFTWQSVNQTYPMHFFAGFMAVTQDPATLAIRPEIGWAVADDKTLLDSKEKHENSKRKPWSKLDMIKERLGR